jgi:hypothetical protein
MIARVIDWCDPHQQRRWVLWAVLAIMALAVLARTVPAPRTIDDAFITFRYSRNINDGLGFVYNADVQTLGTTTPFFTLLMAGMGAFGGRDYPHYALWVSALADALNCALLFYLARRLTASAWAGLLLALLWAIADRSVTFAIGGMEASFVILWMLGALIAYDTLHSTPNNTRAQIALGVFVALALFTRIDSALWIAPLLLQHWWLYARRALATTDGWLARIPWRVWGTTAALLLPWLAFCTVYFGSPIPNSINAKSVAYAVEDGRAFIELALKNYAQPFTETQLSPSAWQGTAGLASILLYLTLASVAALRLRHHAPHMLALWVYPWLYLAAFSIANPHIFRWYTNPPMPALLLFYVVGLWALVGALTQRGGRNVVIARNGLLAAVALFWLAASLNNWELQPNHGPQRPAPRMAWHKIELIYQEIGVLLRDQYGATAATRVASADIGAVGYFSGARIIDTVGLVTPELRRYYPFDRALLLDGEVYVVPPQLLFDTMPDFFVTPNGFIILGLLQNPQFHAQYTLIAEYPLEAYGGMVQVYQRTQNTLIRRR